MIIILSPAKTMDFGKPGPGALKTVPESGKEAAVLAGLLRTYSATRLGKLMGISSRLAYLNHDRYQQWRLSDKFPEAKQAILAYNGDVYHGLDAGSFSESDLLWAQDHLRILSGLYGILRPLDMIMPYRLDMGTRLSGDGFSDLYAYWSEKITSHLKALAAAEGSGILLNLASAEYSKAVEWKGAGLRVITPVFREYRNGEYRFMSMYGKKARGMMARYVIEKRIKDPEELKLFSEDAYTYHDPLSKDGEWTFTR